MKIRRLFMWSVLIPVFIVGLGIDLYLERFFDLPKSGSSLLTTLAVMAPLWVFTERKNSDAFYLPVVGGLAVVSVLMATVGALVKGLPVYPYLRYGLALGPLVFLGASLVLKTVDVLSKRALGREVDRWCLEREQKQNSLTTGS